MERKPSIAAGTTYKPKKFISYRLLYDVKAWLVMLPSLVLFFIFVWRPLLSGVFMSFFETQGFTITQFIGLRNYQDLLADPVFHQALWNSVQYTLWSLVFGFLTPIIVALLISEVVHANSFFKFAAYFPCMVPGVAVMLMWGFLFEPSENGVLNVILSMFHLGPFEWLQDQRMTIPLIVIAMTWKAFGGTMLVYLAAIKGVNQELYEAATIDGAGVFQRLWHVTMPRIYNTGRLLLIMQVISVFQIFYEPFIMTDGGPQNASVSLMLLNYNYAFKDFNTSKAMAVGGIVFVILMVLTAIYLKVTRENETE